MADNKSVIGGGGGGGIAGTRGGYISSIDESENRALDRIKFIQESIAKETL